MAFPATDVVDIRILLLFIHQLRLLYHFYNDVKLVPDIDRQDAVTTVTDHLELTAQFKLQEHKAILLIKGQFYMDIAILKVLLLKLIKEPIHDLIGELMNPRF